MIDNNVEMTPNPDEERASVKDEVELIWNDAVINRNRHYLVDSTGFDRLLDTTDNNPQLVKAYLPLVRRTGDMETIFRLIAQKSQYAEALRPVFEVEPRLLRAYDTFGAWYIEEGSRAEKEEIRLSPGFDAEAILAKMAETSKLYDTLDVKLGEQDDRTTVDFFDDHASLIIDKYFINSPKKHNALTVTVAPKNSDFFDFMSQGFVVFNTGMVGGMQYLSGFNVNKDLGYNFKKNPFEEKALLDVVASDDRPIKEVGKAVENIRSVSQYIDKAGRYR